MKVVGISSSGRKNSYSTTIIQDIFSEIECETELIPLAGKQMLWVLPFGNGLFACGIRNDISWLASWRLRLDWIVRKMVLPILIS